MVMIREGACLRSFRLTDPYGNHSHRGNGSYTSLLSQTVRGRMTQGMPIFAFSSNESFDLQENAHLLHPQKGLGFRAYRI